MVLESLHEPVAGVTGGVASSSRGPAVRVDVLGPVRVHVGGRPVAVDAAKDRSVLAVLALDARRTVSVATLVDALWGDDPPASAVKLVQGCVSSLRKILGDGVVLTEPGGYRLAESVVVDVDAAVAAAAAGERAAADGDLDGAARHLREALSRWRGEPLAELADAPFRWGQQARLEEERLVITGNRVEVELAAGRHRELVPELELLVSAEPLRERFWMFLMLALYRSGRSAEALRAAQRLRELLADELGVEPGAPVTELEDQIARGDPALDLPRPPAAGKVPGALSSFVGRVGDVEAVVEAVIDHRLVTLLGPGGVGKSRLALEVARQLRAQPVEIAENARIDSVWWVDLASVEGEGVVVRQVAQSMDVVPAGVPVEQALAARLRSSRPVLVLDNCEHLVEQVAEFVVWLGGVTTSARVIATSRVALGLPGERRWLVEPLAVPTPGDSPAASEAVQLFLERAADRVDRSSLDLEQVAEICRTVDGLPLAIELAAAMCSLRSASEIARTLRDRSELLGLSGTTSAGRRVSLDEALDVGRSSVDSSASDAFGALSVFTGDFTLGAACAVIGGADDRAVHAVRALVDASLLTPSHDHGAERRFRMLWPVREYAAAHVDAERAARAAAAHAAFFEDLAGRTFDALDGPEEAETLAELRRDLHNVVAALAWAERCGDPNRMLRLGLGLAAGWQAWDEYDELKAHIGRLAVACPTAPPVAAAWIGLLSVWAETMCGDVDAGFDLATRAVADMERLGDRRGLSMALRFRAHVRLLGWADSEGAFADYRRAIDVAEEAGLATSAAATKCLLVQSLALSELREALDVDTLLDESERVFRADGNHLGLAMVALDRVFLSYGRHDDAAWAEAAEALLRHGRLAGAAAYEQPGLLSLGVWAHDHGESQRGRDLFEQAVDLASRTGNLLGLGIAFSAVAATSAADDPERAARLWGAALELAPLWPLFARRYGALMEPARSGLGGRFDELARAGARMSTDEAIQLSRELTSRH